MDYFDRLDDPFDEAEVKINDGRVRESKAVKLRFSGYTDIWLGGLTHFYIVPTMANTVAWSDNMGNGLGSGCNPSTVHAPDHVNTAGTVVNYALYHRLVSCAVRLKMTIEKRGTEIGTWEAIRVPLLGVSGTDMGSTNGCWYPNYNFQTPFEGKVLSTNPTYQTGMLRDLEDYVFKLNMENNDKNFDTNVYKRGWDMIYIRLKARNGTRITWKAVSNQEIVYKEPPYSYFHTNCETDPDIDDIIASTRRTLPGTYSPLTN